MNPSLRRESSQTGVTVTAWQPIVEGPGATWSDAAACLQTDRNRLRVSEAGSVPYFARDQVLREETSLPQVWKPPHPEFQPVL